MHKNNYRNNEPQSVDLSDIDLENEEWKPTAEAFKSFVTRDEQLAQSNIKILLSKSYPMSLREIKECVLHSSDMVERVLQSLVTNKFVSESKGLFSLRRN